MASIFTYTKVVDSDRLKKEIDDSTITIQLLHIITAGGDVTITFKADLPTADETELNTLVTNHVAIPLKPAPIEVVSLPQDPDGIAYQARTYDLDLTATPGADGFIEKEISFSHHDITLLLAQLCFETAQVGDEIEGVIEPDTPFGVISQDLQVNDTDVYCAASSLALFRPGMFLTLSDGNNTVDMGEVQLVDNQKIVCENGTSVVFATSTPTYIHAKIKAIRDFVVPFAGHITLGSAHNGGSKLLKNWKLKLRYRVNGASTITTHVVLEFLYQSLEG